VNGFFFGIYFQSGTGRQRRKSRQTTETLPGIVHLGFSGFVLVFNEGGLGIFFVYRGGSAGITGTEHFVVLFGFVFVEGRFGRR